MKKIKKIQDEIDSYRFTGKSDDNALALVLQIIEGVLNEGEEDE